MSKARNLADSYTDSEIDNDVIDAKAGRKNLIINGAMQVAQRGTSLASPQNYSLDRWKSLRYAAGNYTVSQQIVDVDGHSKALRVQRNAGDTSGNSFAVNQPLEASTSYPLKNKQVTLTLWLRVGADFSCTAENLDILIGGTTSSSETFMNYGTFADNWINIAVHSPSTLPTSWTKYTLTGTVPSSCNQVGVAVQAKVFSGTAGANDWFEITGVQLELGSQATDFEYRSYGEELALCQRYYQIIPTGYTITTAPEFYAKSGLFLGVMRTVPTLLGGSTLNGATFIISERSWQQLSAATTTTFGTLWLDAEL